MSLLVKRIDKFKEVWTVEIEACPNQGWFCSPLSYSIVDQSVPTLLIFYIFLCIFLFILNVTEGVWDLIIVDVRLIYKVHNSSFEKKKEEEKKREKKPN